MSDDGLSIFDEEPKGKDANANANEPTQVMPAVKDEKPATPQAVAPRSQKPTTPDAPVRPQPSTGTNIRPATPKLPTLPVVRRGGYDQSAVDAAVRQLATEKAGLGASLQQSEQRVLDLEKQVADQRKQIQDAGAPTDAALGGRAIRAR